MKKLAILLASFLLLSGCYEKEKASSDDFCFSIMDSPQMPNKILINQCTGETWALLYIENQPNGQEAFGGITYQWKKINRYDDENIFAGF